MRAPKLGDVNTDDLTKITSILAIFGVLLTGGFTAIDKFNDEPASPYICAQWFGEAFDDLAAHPQRPVNSMKHEHQHRADQCEWTVKDVYIRNDETQNIETDNKEPDDKK